MDSGQARHRDYVCKPSRDGSWPGSSSFQMGLVCGRIDGSAKQRSGAPVESRLPSLLCWRTEVIEALFIGMWAVGASTNPRRVYKESRHRDSRASQKERRGSREV